jgi:hypothetical protein
METRRAVAAQDRAGDGKLIADQMSQSFPNAAKEGRLQRRGTAAGCRGIKRLVDLLLHIWLGFNGLEFKQVVLHTPCEQAAS